MSTRGDLIVTTVDSWGRRDTNRFFIVSDAYLDDGGMKLRISEAYKKAKNEEIPFVNALLSLYPKSFGLQNTDREGGYSYHIDFAPNNPTHRDYTLGYIDDKTEPIISFGYSGDPEYSFSVTMPLKDFVEKDFKQEDFIK